VTVHISSHTVLWRAIPGMRTKEKEKQLENFRATCRQPEIIFMVDFLGKYFKKAGNC